jgi:hypothetical protein
VTRGAIFAACLLPFLVLATLNSAGYRYGASDQAFYLPAILERIDPGLFPHDSALIGSQAKLTLVDETLAALARALPVDLPVLFAAGYVVSLALLVWGAIGVGDHLFRSRWAIAALLAALTLRHAITKTGTNTLEGYFHPRQLAFALGLIALAGFLRRGIGVSALLLGIAAAVHPTTAMWFIVWLGVAAFVAEPRYRPVLALAGAAVVNAAIFMVTLGPLRGRLAPMDGEWLATLATKDYLFPLQWPAAAWLVNLGYIPIILILLRRRRDAGVVAPREIGMVVGCLALVVIFAIAIVLHNWHIALAIQLQPARIFWMLDFLAITYVVWLICEDATVSPRRAALGTTVVVLLTIVRGGYVAMVRFPERPMFALGVRDDDWGRVMGWARTSGDRGSGWLADPFHAAIYGTSVRVAGHRDVFVEAIKDSAIGMYDRPVAMRTRDRIAALGNFSTLTADHARALASQYALDYLVTEQALDLPVAFRSGRLTVYRLR